MDGYGGVSGNVPSGRLPTAINVLPFAAAVVGCVSLALVTGDPAAALMRSVVESDRSPNGSTGHVVAPIKFRLAARQSRNEAGHPRRSIGSSSGLSKCHEVDARCETKLSPYPR